MLSRSLLHAATCSPGCRRTRFSGRRRIFAPWPASRWRVRPTTSSRRALASFASSIVLPVRGRAPLDTPAAAPGCSPGRLEPPRLPVEPEVFVAVAVVDAVDQDGQPLDPRMAASRLMRIENDGPRNILDQPPLDLPHELLPLLWVGLHRLRVDQLVDFRIAIAGVVAFRAAHVILVELLVWVVDPGFGDVEPDREVAPRPRRVPLGGVERVEHPVYIDLLQLVDQDHRRVAIGRDVAGRYGDRETLVRPVAGLLHDRARLGAVLRDVGAIAGQFLEHFFR